MSERKIQFTNFIIKKIFRGVALGDSSENESPEDIYVFFKRELNESLLNEIFEEGNKYGYDKARCLNEIKLADDKLVTSPSIERIETSLDLSTLSPGTRFDLLYEHPLIGDFKIEGILSEDRAFVVLDSTILGLQYRDVMYPVKVTLGCGVKTYYRLYRDSMELTSASTLFSPGTLKSVDIYTPSFVFSILDSDTSFLFEDLGSKEKKDKQNTPEKKQASSSAKSYNEGDSYYISFYHDHNSKSWGEEELKADEDTKDKSLYPFIITITQADNAEISINPLFKFNKRKSHYTYEIDQFQQHCEVTGTMNVSCKIKVMKAGILTLDSARKWILRKKMQIECVPGLNPKTFNIVKQAVFKVLRKVITPEDADKELAAFGSATLPFKVSLIQEMEEIGKVNLPDANASEVFTIMDLYNLLDTENQNA